MGSLRAQTIGAFYQRFEIPGYRELPARHFEEVMDFLREWYLTAADTKAPPFQVKQKG